MIHQEPQRLVIERYIAQELSGSEKNKLEEHFKECVVCNDYYANLHTEMQQFLRIHSFSEFKGVHNKRLLLKKKHSYFFDFLGKPFLAPALTMLLLVAVLTPVFLKSGMFTNTSEIGYKGKSGISFICERNGNVFPGNPNDVFHENDKIQILYSSSKKQFISLASVDNKGKVSFYQPDQTSDHCSIETGIGDQLAYPGGILLDASSGSELVVAIFSSGNLSCKKIRSEIYSRFSKNQSIEMLAKDLEQNKLFENSSIQILLLKKG
jgi:hypothetical protein